MSDFFSRKRRNACSCLDTRSDASGGNYATRKQPLLSPLSTDHFLSNPRHLHTASLRKKHVGFRQRTDTRSALRPALRPTIDFSALALRFRSEPAASRRGSHEAFSLSVAMHRDSAELEARSRESRLTRRNAHALRFRNA